MTGFPAINAISLGKLSSGWEQLAAWWLSGLCEIVPASWRRMLEGQAVTRLFVWRDGDHVACRLDADEGRREARFPAGDFHPSVLEQWLLQAGLRREQVALAPVLDEASFLQRQLRVPRQALPSLPEILQQEIARRTPFQPGEIWHAAQRRSSETDGAIVSLSHWIIPKDRAAALVEPTGIPLEYFDCLATRAADGGIWCVIPLRTMPAAQSPLAWRAIKWLAALLLASILMGLLVFEWTQAGVADDLQSELATARRTVQGDSGSDQLARIYALKAAPGFLAVWDELSRVLPSDTFLTEVRKSADRVTISGFSSQAAHLIRTIDGSPLFSGAALVAAIIPDANEGKDRFQIAFKVRNGLTAPSARMRKPGE